MSKGGLAFLNKKSWHTQSIQNIERVWIAEQKQKQEKQRLEQLRKELEEERQIEELRRLKMESGLISRAAVQRLDWMYQDPGTSEVVAEEYLLGKRTVEDKKENTDVHKTQQAEGSLFINKKANVVQEEKSRLRDDPLMGIMKAEHKQRQDIVSNPVKMGDIRKRAKLLKKLRKAQKKHAKKAKKARKKAHKRRKEGRDSGDDGEVAERAARRKSPSPPAPVVQDRDLGGMKATKYGLIHPKGEAVTGVRASEHPVAKAEALLAERERAAPRAGGLMMPSRSSGAREEQGSRRRREDSGRSGDRDRYRERGRGRGRRSRSRSRSGGRRDRRRRWDRRSRSPPPRKHGYTRSRSRSRERRKPHRDPAVKPLTAEEKARRLREMMADGEKREAEVLDDLQTSQKITKEEERRYKDNKLDPKQAGFIQKLNKNLYTGEESVEDRLKKYAHYRQKGDDAFKSESFMRRN